MSKERDEMAMEWRKKNAKMKKNQFIRELDQIKLQKHTIERERIGFMYEKNDKQYNHLEDIEKGLNEELKTERLKLEQQLKKIRLKVSDFQRELKHVKPTPEFVKKLKSTMEDIESTIGDFKQKQRDIFESLMISEKETEQEIKALEGKINALQNIAAPVSARQIKAKTNHFQSDFPKEIQEFENFVSQHGGLQGGWDDYDHGTFLRIRDKYKGNKSFITPAARQIPGRSEKDIEDHERWYTHFIELKKKKKEVIATWRKRKEEKENVDLNESVEDEEAKRLREEKEELLKRREQEEKEAKKKELQAWKARKRVEQEITQERKMQEEKLKQESEERKRKEREEEIRQVRAKLKERREEDERLQWMKEFEDEQLEKERQQEVREKISRFQARDRVSLKIKQNEQKRKEEMEIIKKERLERTKEKVRASRDPTRLYQMTEGWVHRTQDNTMEKPLSSNLARMPHRAVPTWRQNL